MGSEKKQKTNDTPKEHSVQSPPGGNNLYALQPSLLQSSQRTISNPSVGQIVTGDCQEILKEFPDNTVDLIFTSPSYADQRSATYGGIRPDQYVRWFMPKAEQFLRVLKPTGSFILNIKERVVNGERHTYVIELILEMRKLGWLWTEEYLWHKKTAILESGSTGFVTTGSGCCISQNPDSSICIKMR